MLIDCISNEKGAQHVSSLCWDTIWWANLRGPAPTSNHYDSCWVRASRIDSTWAFAGVTHASPCQTTTLSRSIHRCRWAKDLFGKVCLPVVRYNLHAWGAHCTVLAFLLASVKRHFVPTKTERGCLARKLVTACANKAISMKLLPPNPATIKWCIHQRATNVFRAVPRDANQWWNTAPTHVKVS